MAEVTGAVQRLEWNAGTGTLLASIGPDPTAVTVLSVVIGPADAPEARSVKRGMMRLLDAAHLGGYPVTADYAAPSSAITLLTVGPPAICAIGQPVQGDFFTVSGTGFTADATLVFTVGGVAVTVVPDMVRSHLLLVGRLPANIPVGRNLLSVQSAAGTTPAAPVDVSSGPATTVRVLHPGTPKTAPYTIVFVANPAILSEAGTIGADPVLTDRPTYHAGVVYCMQNLFTQTEDVLRALDLDAGFRIVSIFDPTIAASAATALAKEDPPDIMEPQRSLLASLLSGYGERADVVMVLHGSTTHTRSSAWFTSDDPAGASTSFTYDGTTQVHGHFNTVPGSAALPASVSTGMTPLHEFGHACSDFTNGMIVDLYVDGGPGGFQVNRKFRASATDAIPASFANYNGTAYASDQNRDSLGYPASWLSYHPVLIDATRPDVMDNYWLAGNPLLCREDRLDYDFMRDRINAKASR
jgi:hypothetical protein